MATRKRIVRTVLREIVVRVEDGIVDIAVLGKAVVIPRWKSRRARAVDPLDVEEDVEVLFGNWRD